MADSSKFDFCPKCGALARDGVCQSCGYQSPGVTSTATQNHDLNTQNPGQQQNTTGQNPYTQGQGPSTSQPQLSQGQGVFTGHPQPNQGQGIPIQPQAPRGQGIPTGQPQYTQGPYTPQPVPSGSQGYGPYIQAVPPEVKNKGSKKTAIILSIVIGVVVIALIALIFLVAGNAFTTFGQNDKNPGGGSADLGSKKDKEYMEQYTEESVLEEDNDNDQQIKAEAAFIHYTLDTTSLNLDDNGQDTSLSYYSGPYNAIKDNLSYQIGFTTDSCYSKSYPNIGIDIEYPQIISGDISYKSDINNALYYEYSYYEDYLKEFVGEITGEGDSFQCYSDAYVTYMDEKILSVVFKEQFFITVGSDSYSSICLYCLNFDLENGSLLDNTKLLSMDEAFALDFRQREATENGEEALTIYSDQEIQDMLNDPQELVIFYTPMGMEVGLNLDERVVYVTYEDYQSYLSNY
ncbi:MAG TPA: hypothetical protein VJY54_00075 [Lachnospiraceae bacterium]|nr:hypothetical protein [Lachnospiraceae bacterium]